MGLSFPRRGESLARRMIAASHRVAEGVRDLATNRSRIVSSIKVRSLATATARADSLRQQV